MGKEKLCGDHLMGKRCREKYNALNILVYWNMERRWGRRASWKRNT
jgi:hypothetical protein